MVYVKATLARAAPKRVVSNRRGRAVVGSNLVCVSCRVHVTGTTGGRARMFSTVHRRCLTRYAEAKHALRWRLSGRRTYVLCE